MILPSLKREGELRRAGYKLIAGLDEVGRGAWAGPIMAAAVILPVRPRIKGIRDSKLLNPHQREELFLQIIKLALGWSVSKVSPQVIDRIGIAKANSLVMRKALRNLALKPDYLLIDAWKLSRLKIPAEAISQGDTRVYSIACASIVAKVTRDRLMRAYQRKYPHYNFAAHKGYGTKKHWQMICEYGVCKIHRRSFQPMRDFV